MQWLNGQGDEAQGDGGRGTSSSLPAALGHPLLKFPAAPVYSYAVLSEGRSGGDPQPVSEAT